MTIRETFPHSVIETPDMRITLPDGCTLSARVWMPEGADTSPVPAILEYIPYRKRDGTLARDELMHPWWAGHGYACLRVDMRGSGDSAGILHDEYTETELQDACDVIAWIADQSWCTGAVGMMGKSWGGFNCLQTAFRQPEALKAVVSVCSTTDRFADDIHFKGGCLLGSNISWGAVMLSYSSRPPDPALRQGWREDWMARLDTNPNLAARWASHQSRDTYWKHGSICEDYDRMKVAILSIGGWADNYMNTVSHLVTNIPGAKGIVGPWVHQYPHTADPEPRIGFLQEAKRFWDKWLKGLETGADTDPAYRAYMLDSAPPDACASRRPGTWIAEDVWPSERVSFRTMPLSDRGLDREGPLTATVQTPQNLGLWAGEYFPMGLNGEMPGDQRFDDSLSTVFDSAPLEAPLSLLGAPILQLNLRSDQPKGHIIARLCDVAPDGASVRICHGMLNLSHRNDAGAPSDLVPGQSVDITLTLDQCGYRLAKGHRLRISFSTTYWPFVWPSAHNPLIKLENGSLTLPIHPGGENDECTFEAPETAMPANLNILDKGGHTRRIETDVLTGVWSLVTEEIGDLVENRDHGLVTRHSVRTVWSIHPDDPLSARTEIIHDQHLSRGDWIVSTRAEATMWADETDFHMSGKLTAQEGGDVVFERDYSDAVRRKHL